MASQLRKNMTTGRFEVRDLDTMELISTHSDYWDAKLWVDEREALIIDAMIESGELDAESLAHDDDDEPLSEDQVRDNLIMDIINDDPDDVYDASDLEEMTTDELRDLAS